MAITMPVVNQSDDYLAVTPRSGDCREWLRSTEIELEMCIIGPRRIDRRATGCIQIIDIFNKDCMRSISAIVIWVPENVKISVFTLLLKLYLLPLAHILLRVKCRYVSLVCLKVNKSCLLAVRIQLMSDVVHATRQVCRPAEKTAGQKNTRHNFVYIYAN